MLDKILVVLGGILVSIFVARYLGPDNFGKITLGVTLSGFSLIISQWGASQFIFSLYSKNNFKAINYVFTSEGVRTFIYIIVVVFVFIFLQFTKYAVDSFFLLAVMLSQIFFSLDLYQFILNASLSSKVSAKSNMIGVLCANLLRVILVLSHSSAILFIIPYFINGFIQWFRKKKYVRENLLGGMTLRMQNMFFKRGRDFLIITLVSFIMSKSNYLFLGFFLDYESLAIFSAMFMLSYSWIFFPQAICTSLLAHILSNEKIKEENISPVILVNILIFIPVLIVVCFFSNYIIEISFGFDYIAGREFIIILFISSFFSCLNFSINRVISRYHEGGSFLLKKNIILTFLMLPMSFTLISNFGAYGAAWSILLIESLGSVVLNLFFNKGVFVRVFLNLPFSSKLLINMLLKKA
nr:oligosaccharide flippase family protein [Vibrio cyclitrophicus]PME23531.1 hypothetical protein BCV41_20210 [Vibrio cyclitrophicus]